MSSFEESVRSALSSAVLAGRRLESGILSTETVDWEIGHGPIFLSFSVRVMAYNSMWGWAARAGWPSGVQWHHTEWLPVDEAARQAESEGVPAFCEAVRALGVSLLRADVSLADLGPELHVLDVMCS